MSEKTYPYIPNSNPNVKRQMMDFLGIQSVSELTDFIPDSLVLKQPMNLPKPKESEYELKKYVQRILDEDVTVDEMKASFLGAGCYDHYIPAVVDEIGQRSEFVTAYSGDTYADHGKQQAFFEFSSMMGELVGMDVVGFPTYDGGQAAATSMMMSGRITGRKQILVPESVNPQLWSIFTNYCEGMELIKVKCGGNGQIDLEDFKAKCGDQTACVWLANPSFYGFFEENAPEVGKIAHQNGAVFIIYADPSSLGVTAAPADYGADIVCGDIQPLGIHMNFGGGQGGYIAFRAEEKYVMNYPGHLHQIYFNPDGQFGFGRAFPERTSYYRREKGVEYLGTCVGLWTVTAAVYLAVMGPAGMQKLGENILAKSAYAQQELQKIKGIRLPFSASESFMEFVVNFDGTGKSVAEINRKLLGRKILGGYDLSREKPELGQSMLVCVTEKTEKEQIDDLANALRAILQEE